MGRTRFVCTMGLAYAMCLTSPLLLMADWYDTFYDGQYCQDPNDPCSFDPNRWDIDNPHWTIHEFLGTNFYHSAQAGGLELGADPDPCTGVAWVFAEVNDGDTNGNTSTTWFDNSAPHYITTYFDPNLGGVGSVFFMELCWNQFIA